MGVEGFQSTRIPRAEPKRTIPVGMTLGLRGFMLCGGHRKRACTPRIGHSIYPSVPCLPWVFLFCFSLVFETDLIR